MDEVHLTLFKFIKLLSNKFRSICECFFPAAIYDEIEDDGLRTAFSPVAIQRKIEALPYEAVPSTSGVPKVILKAVATPAKPDTERRPRRKRKTADKYDEPLEQFLARRKRVKKQKKEKKGGLQLMMTDYFQFTKPVIKCEKTQKDTALTTPATDILQSKQYDFDRSAIPQMMTLKLWMLFLHVILMKGKPGHLFMMCRTWKIQMSKWKQR